MAYRVEQAASKRAICKNTECKKSGVKIEKGELRLGSWVDYGENQSWAWKHWGCVTPKQIESLKTATEDDVNMLDGYEELPTDLQEKVKAALENGHVADEDWKGDLAQNRPGMKGFRSPAPKKSKKTAEQGDSGEENGEQSPSKPASKKRGRVKKEDAEEDDVEQPIKKKTKAPAKKGKNVKNEEDAGADEMAVDEPAASPKTPAKKGRQAKAKNTGSDEATKPKAKATGKKAKSDQNVEDADEGDTAVVVPKKAKAAGKKGKKNDHEEAGDVDVQPKKAAGRPRKAKAEDARDQDLAGGQEDQSKPMKKTGATKNAANTKKPIAKKAVKDKSADAVETPAQETTKVKKSRKKADVS